MPLPDPLHPTSGAKIVAEVPQCPPCVTSSTRESEKPIRISSKTSGTIVSVVFLVGIAVPFLKDNQESARSASTAVANSLFLGDTPPECSAIPSRRNLSSTHILAPLPTASVCSAATFIADTVRTGLRRRPCAIRVPFHRRPESHLNSWSVMPSIKVREFW